MGYSVVIALLQRVDRATVSVEGTAIATAGRGLLVFLGVERNDHEPQAERLAERTLGYRVFPDGAGRMNLSVCDIRGDLLLVPQFTLAADTRSGNRPGFETAAPPETGRRLFEHFARRMAEQSLAHGVRVSLGRFGADMQVELVNAGPVTFSLRAAPDD